MGLARIELATSSLSAMRSNRLSYRPLERDVILHSAAEGTNSPGQSSKPGDSDVYLEGLFRGRFSIFVERPVPFSGAFGPLSTAGADFTGFFGSAAGLAGAGFVAGLAAAFG